MTEEKMTDTVEERPQTEAQARPAMDVTRRIPATSVAVMIFILLVAFACTGVSVVTNIINEKYAPIEIKGKDTFGKPAQYPTLSTDLPKGVAGKVGDVEIPESQVTNFILNLREKVGLEDQEAWDQWMIENRRTSETLRNQVLLSFINNEIVEQMADELDIHPTEADYQVTRDEVFYSPEATAALEAALAAEGRTLDDYEADIVTKTKKRLVIEKNNEGVADTPEFDEAVLTIIKSQLPEYAEVESLDQVDPKIVEQVSTQVLELSNQQAFSDYLKKFIKERGAYFSPVGKDLPYTSSADAYFAQEEFVVALEEALKQSGVEVGEDGLFGEDGILSGHSMDSES